MQAQRIQRGRDDIRVIVRYPIDERRTISALSEMLITAPNGRQVPLANVAEITPGRGPSQITRIDGYRVLNVTADVDKENTNMIVLMKDLQRYVDNLLVKYPSITYIMEGEQARQAETFGSLGTGIMIVLFVIYCMLALPLKSYTQPLIVMSVIPFGFIGAVLGHWFMGVTMTILSVLGLMALTGVVINDSLVLVDFVNQRHGNAHRILHDQLHGPDALADGQVVFRSVPDSHGYFARLRHFVCNTDHTDPGANEPDDRRRCTALFQAACQRNQGCRDGELVGKFCIQGSEPGSDPWC